MDRILENTRTFLMIASAVGIGIGVYKYELKIHLNKTLSRFDDDCNNEIDSLYRNAYTEDD